MIVLGLAAIQPVSISALEISGRVLDASNSPRAGVFVTATPLVCGAELGLVVESVRTDRSGQFVLKGLEHGAWLVRVRGAGAAWVAREVPALVRDLRLPPLTLPGGRAWRLLEKGRKVAGVEVSLVREDHFGRVEWRTRSDQEGVVRLSVFDPETPDEVEVSGRPLESVADDLWRLGGVEEAAMASGRNGRASESRSVRVKVATRWGEAVPNAVLGARLEECWYWALTDREGEATLALPADTSAELVAVAAGYSPGVAKLGRFRELDVFLEAAPWVLEGTVEDITGSGLSDALVSWPALGRGVVSGDGGRFALHDFDLEKNTPHLVVSKPGYLEQRVATEAGYANFEREVLSRPPVILRRPWLVTGRAVLGSGESAGACEVLLASEPEIRARCDSAGRFELTPVAGGRHLLLLRQGSDGEVLVDLELQESAPNPYSLGDLLLGEEGGVVSGWVVDEGTGGPVLGASIYADISPGGRRRWERQADFRPELPKVTATGVDGGFRVGGLPLGRSIHLEIWHPEYLPAEVDSSQTAEDIETEVTVALARAAQVSLQVVDQEDRRPIPGVPLSVKISDSRRKAASFSGSRPFMVTGQEGRVRFLAPPESTLEVTLVHSTYSGERLSVEVEEAGPVDLVLPVWRGAQVAGQLLDRFLEPVRRGQVRIVHRDSESPHWIDSLDADGRFDIFGLRPGPNTLRVLVDGVLVQEFPIELSAGSQQIELQLTVPLPDS